MVVFVSCELAHASSRPRNEIDWRWAEIEEGKQYAAPNEKKNGQRKKPD